MNMIKLAIRQMSLLAILGLFVVGPSVELARAQEAGCANILCFEPLLPVTDANGCDRACAPPQATESHCFVLCKECPPGFICILDGVQFESLACKLVGKDCFRAL